MSVRGGLRRPTRSRAPFFALLLWLAAAGAEESGGTSTTTTEFGPAARSLFQFADGFTNLNHGSFGSTPKEVIIRVWGCWREYPMRAHLST